MKKKLSFLLSLILIFNVFCSSITPVYAASSSTTQANFINFYAKGDEVVLDMANLTTNDYYAMFAYMSNWFEPGKTTLADVVNASKDTAFYKNFVAAIQKSDSEKLLDIVHSFGSDVMTGINSGKCILLDSGGEIVNGKIFLTAILNSVDNSDVDLGRGEKEESFSLRIGNSSSYTRLYFGDTSHIAFDFTIPAFRAAFQTVMAYNPDLFLNKNGVGRMYAFYLDAIGNLWAVCSDTFNENLSAVDSAWGYSGSLLSESDLNKVYLVLPACLNPSTFTPNAKDITDLRMPLMNRFVISSLVLPSDLQKADGSVPFANSYVPIYDLTAAGFFNPNQGHIGSALLAVYGISALSPYTFNTDEIVDVKNVASRSSADDKYWTAEKRIQDLANFVYNDKSFVVTGDNDTKGISQYQTYNYIVFAMNLKNLEVLKSETSETDNIVDLFEGFKSIFGDGKGTPSTIDIGELNEREKIQSLLSYFFSPTILDLTHVSMNFYTVDETSNDLASDFEQYLITGENNTDDGDKVLDVESENTPEENEVLNVSETALSASEITKMGLRGMSLFLNDAQYKVRGTDGKIYYYVSPDKKIDSKFVSQLNAARNGLDYNATTYKEIMSNGFFDTDSPNALNYLFLGTSFGSTNMYSNINYYLKRRVSYNLNEATNTADGEYDSGDGVSKRRLPYIGIVYSFYSFIDDRPPFAGETNVPGVDEEKNLLSSDGTTYFGLVPGSYVPLQVVSFEEYEKMISSFVNIGIDFRKTNSGALIDEQNHYFLIGNDSFYNINKSYFNIGYDVTNGESSAFNSLFNVTLSIRNILEKSFGTNTSINKKSVYKEYLDSHIDYPLLPDLAFFGYNKRSELSVSQFGTTRFYPTRLYGKGSNENNTQYSYIPMVNYFADTELFYAYTDVETDASMEDGAFDTLLHNNYSEGSGYNTWITADTSKMFLTAATIEIPSPKDALFLGSSIFDNVYDVIALIPDTDYKMVGGLFTENDSKLANFWKKRDWGESTTATNAGSLKFRMYSFPEEKFVGVNSADNWISNKLFNYNELGFKSIANYSVYDTLDLNDGSMLEMLDYLMALYGYSLFLPSSYIFPADAYREFPVLKGNTYLCGQETVTSKSGIAMRDLPQDYLMGIYLGYIVDMMGFGAVDEVVGIRFGVFSSPYLPTYTISAKGGVLDLSTYTRSTMSGVNRQEDTTLEEAQENIIMRILQILNPFDSEYRNAWLKSIIEGFFLTIHRTITGTFGSSISTVSTGSSSTYQSVTGYIYTPNLEELSFTAVMLDNYMNIYIFGMLLIIFFLVLMVLLHMRTVQQGVITFVLLAVGLMFPYVVIENSINVTNKIANNVYSDRFDFWALIEHYQSLQTIQDFNFVDDKDQWYMEANATNDETLLGESGIKIRWMSPKKVDAFNSLYGENSYSDNFATNMVIFRWLFNSVIYDSEFVYSNPNATYVYRQYKTIALEAQTYYDWGTKAFQGSLASNSGSIRYDQESGKEYFIPSYFANSLNVLQSNDMKLFGAGIGRIDNSFYSVNGPATTLKMQDETLSDVDKVRAKGSSDFSNKVGLWGIVSTEVSNVLGTTDFEGLNGYGGIVSNLPLSSIDSNFFEKQGNNASDVSKAIFLKNTESPFYYFYSVLKSRYSGSNDYDSFKDALLAEDVFVVKNSDGLNTNSKVGNAVRDFLDLEGLFEYVIPYMKLSNEYVENWQAVYGSDIETYNFDYTVTASGDVIANTDNLGEGEDAAAYQKAVNRKNQLNKIWNMYCPWVDSLYDLDVFNKRVKVGGSNVYISDTLNPTSYNNAGRPMIFSEADMLVKGYSYSNLTDVERKIQDVLDKTYTDIMYLINYYDFDEEVLISAAAMYATFNFDSVFSETPILGNNVMIYPQGFELRNFNYDAYMRLAMLNATGESVFDTEDLYVRILSKTSVFTGILLIVCDLIAVVLIPALKFIIIVALLFLGVLLCMACVLNPPEKILKTIISTMIVPTLAFMAMNIGMAWIMSFIVGEGLTAYVGSKNINFETNDPTMTMVLIIIVGAVYCFAAFKLLKAIIEAYKKYGMSTIIAGIGVVSSSIMTAGKNSVKLAGKFVGSGVSGAVGGLIGGLTAEKGEKLSGVADGFTRGAKGIIDRRLSDKRTQRNIAKGMTEKPGVTKGIDKLAKEGETGVSTTSETVKKENNPVIEKPNGGKVNTAQGNDVSETVSTELAPAGESELEKESRVKRLDNLPEGIKADNLLVAQINNLSKTDVDAKTEILSESTVSSDVYSSNSITSSRASDSTTIVDTNVNSATQNNVIYHGSQGRVVGRSESVSSDDVDLSSMRPHAGIPDIEAPFVSSRTQDISKSETATAFDAEENDNRVSNNNRLDYIESEDISSFTTDSSDMTSQVKSRVQSQGKSDTDTTVIPNTSYTVISSDDV